MPLIDSMPGALPGVVPGALPGAAAPVIAPLPAPRAALARDLLRLARPTHWVKSLVVVPLALLDTPVWSWGVLARTGWAVLAFVLATAAVYVGNDIVDRHRDRHHPSKRYRPIAAGRVPVLVGQAYRVALLVVLAAVLVVGPTGQAWPVLAYLVLNTAYSRGLKHVPLVEAGVVALGFVLRVVQGYLATGRPVSGWLLVAVFSGCLLLIIGKRRQELLDSGVAHRPALRGYSVELAAHLLQLTAVLTVMATLAYLRTEAPLTPYGEVAMLLSTPFALYLMSRYLQSALVHRTAGDPVRLLLRDRAVVLTALVWAAALGAVLVAARFPVLTAGPPP